MLTKKPISTNKCLCGCGEYVKEGSKFKLGHNSRTEAGRAQHEKWLNSPEAKAQLERWNSSPEGKAHLKKITEEWNNSPEGKANSKAMGKEMGKKWSNSPEGKAALEKLNETWSRSSEGRANAKKMGDNWVNSAEGRANAIKQLERWNNSPEGIAWSRQLSTIPESIARYKSPEFKIWFKGMRERWNNSLEGKTFARANMRKISKAWHESPEGKVFLERLHNEWSRSPEGKASLASIRQAWQNSPEGKETLKKIGEARGHSPENIIRLLNMPRPQITYGQCGIIGHKHRSKTEIKYCTKLQTTYQSNTIHSCVVCSWALPEPIEIDFVIGESRDDITTWHKVIEIHSRHWDTLRGISNYEKVRTEQLKTAGVECLIEIIIK